MRTTGTLQDVYGAAKSYALATAEDGCPHDPVVRRDENGKWMLESGLNGSEAFEVTLEAFDNYFWEAYKDESFKCDAEIETEFIDAHS